MKLTRQFKVIRTEYDKTHNRVEVTIGAAGYAFDLEQWEFTFHTKWDEAPKLLDRGTITIEMDMPDLREAKEPVKVDTGLQPRGW